MLKILLLSVICLFALYGALQLIKKYTERSIFVNKSEPGNPYTVLTVKNRADSIESEIRSAVWHALSQNHTRYINDFVIVDLGSDDETFYILKSLAREYDFIHPMNKEQYIEYINSM